MPLNLSNGLPLSRCLPLASENVGSQRPALSLPISSRLLPIATNRRRTPMPVGRLGAIEEYPVALVRGARLQPSEPTRLRQTEHLSQHVAEGIRARNRDKLDCSRVGDCQRKRKLPARSGKVTRCLLGLGPMLRRSRKIISQGLPQFQRSPMVADIDVLPTVQQAALAHPRLQQAWRLDLVPTRMGNAVFHEPAPVNAIHEIVKQRQLRRYGIFH
jgi:hypothetical protein